MLRSNSIARVGWAERSDAVNCAEVFDLGVLKTRTTIKRLADDPSRTWAFDQDGDYWRWEEGFFEIGNWTTSFFTGMALLAWQRTGDDFFLDQVRRLEPLYRAKVSDHAMDTMHDLGFLYVLYSVAQYKLTGERAQRDTALRAAEVFAKRFDAKGGYIRAWGRMDELDTDYAGLAIIDCMMNLPLLCWASMETGDQSFQSIATRHADTTMEFFVRPDGSVYHSYRFDPRTGRPLGGDNYCGRGVESYWARGAAWAIYGFARIYGYTQNPKYLETSLQVARGFVENLDEEIVPVWDFRLAEGEPELRDSSAAAIAVCGLQELRRHGVGDGGLQDVIQALLARLCSPDYLNADPACAGLLKHGEVGDGVGKARAAYTSWGDYFLMEALGRELKLEPTFW